MRAPEFWFNAPLSPGWQARLLAPLGALYAYGTRRRIARRDPVKPGCPVVCIGNIHAGGTGKTPSVIAMLQHLSERDIRANVVTRGYTGRLTGPVRVDPATHLASDVGDEPLLIAAFAPVWVARDRGAGVLAAAAESPDLILLDDGFQNPDVQPDLSLIVVDAERGFGNGRCIPAGPLREPVSQGMLRADMVLTIGSDSAQDAFDAQWGSVVHLPRLRAELTPLNTGMEWPGTRVFAFAGIAHPEKFYRTLRDLGAEIAGTVSLDDHQTLTPSLMARIAARADQANAQLVTTEKDAVRIPPEYRAKVLTLPVRLAVDDWATFDRAIDALIA